MFLPVSSVPASREKRLGNPAGQGTGNDAGSRTGNDVMQRARQAVALNAALRRDVCDRDRQTDRQTLHTASGVK